ncbi:MAG: metal-sensitive transcriptional regulator [Longimicrobiales bacterium]|nr:metal-sensitive transcriptional regulator [Longimicrobiales bacterium]
MEHENTPDITRRLKSVEGHVRGVQRMVDEGAYCVDVVNQIVAIQSALKKVSALVLDDHLRSCVTDAMQAPDGDAREKVLAELMQVYDATARL